MYMALRKHNIESGHLLNKLLLVCIYFSRIVKSSLSTLFLSCTPKKNIAFLKTHKCASSAIQVRIIKKITNEYKLSF